MRLFTGLEVPATVEWAMVRPWREAAPGIRWSPLPNLHITTKFIGEWPEERLPELQLALASVAKPSAPLSIAVRGVGWFPDADHPRSLFAVVDGAPQGLRDLAANTQDVLAALGVAREERAYVPHVTLARLNRPSAAELKALREAIAGAVSLDFGVIEARSFFLYLSSESVYKKLAEFSFQ